MSSRDPTLWVGFKTRRGIVYRGRHTSAPDAPAVTYDGEWYLRGGTDADGVRLFRRPWWWERRFRRPVTESLASLQQE